MTDLELTLFKEKSKGMRGWGMEKEIGSMHYRTCWEDWWYDRKQKNAVKGGKSHSWHGKEMCFISPSFYENTKNAIGIGSTW